MAKKRFDVRDDPAFKVGCIVAYWRRDPGAAKSQYVQCSVEEIDGDMAFVHRLDINEERYMPISRFVALVQPPPGWFEQESDDEVPF